MTVSSKIRTALQNLRYSYVISIVNVKMENMTAMHFHPLPKFFPRFLRFHHPLPTDKAELFLFHVFLLWRYHMLTKLLSSPVPGSRKMEYKGNSWHETCFLCHRCQQPIGTKSFIPKDTGYFCVPCFEKQFAYQCCACKKVGLQLSLSYVLPAAGNWLWYFNITHTVAA